MPSITVVHGYLLEGSGSNLWTRSVIIALCKAGHNVHFISQEPHPELFSFISKAYLYTTPTERSTILDRESPYPGRVIMHKPKLSFLPVYVNDSYEEFSKDNVLPIPECSDQQLQTYVDINYEVISRVLAETHPIYVHVNHTVLVSEAVRRACLQSGHPFCVMPHGSAIQYAVLKDKRMMKVAESVFSDATYIFTIGSEMVERITGIWGQQFTQKFRQLPLGCATDQFQMVKVTERPTVFNSLQMKLKKYIEEGNYGRQPEDVFRIERLSEEFCLGSMKQSKFVDRLTSLACESWYNRKYPDQDAVEKLSRIDFVNDQVLLFCGRLISGKGLHCLLIVFPFLFKDNKSPWLVAVGHGPSREILESLIFALKHRDITSVFSIVNSAGDIEGSGGFSETVHFFEQLREKGLMEEYLDRCRESLDRVIFLGYIPHDKGLSDLYALSSIGVFPSIVKEAGPLVFIESVACGAVPLGVYFGGMKYSIDKLEHHIDPDVWQCLKVTPEKTRICSNIMESCQFLLTVCHCEQLRQQLRHVAETKFDWRHCVEIMTKVFE
ncbi:hypothetical protein GEMRC1_013912 [Eukaryota sp. GEM-RC1]